jgi:dihydrofolate synthase / folylpolyglutamate synthase
MARSLTYVEAVRDLESRQIMPDTAPGLAPMEEGLRRISFDSYGFDPAKVIIVAGTNGKGSVCASLEALLYSAGERVGLYTSPHLVELTERFRIDGDDISRELFARAFEKVSGATSDLALTHFEILTLMAAWTFCSGEAVGPVDRLILEVGLGGLWDATNAIPHRTCIITPIALDHQNLLGDTIEAIAGNKFGVVSQGALVVHAHLPTFIRQLASHVQKQTESRWIEAMPYRYSANPPKAPGGEPQFFFQSSFGTAQLALPGKRGAENTAIALTAFQELGFDATVYLACLKHVRWPGRMERFKPLVPAVCPIYLSGDHNVQGIRSLLEFLPHYPRKHLHILASTAKDKDIEGILQPLFNTPESSVYLTRNPFRGGELSEYGNWLMKAHGAWEDPATAFQRVLEMTRPGDLVVVTGSLYLVGLIKKLFGQPL